jgi:hypothetical protein
VKSASGSSGNSVEILPTILHAKQQDILRKTQIRQQASAAGEARESPALNLGGILDIEY